MTVVDTSLARQEIVIRLHELQERCVDLIGVRLLEFRLRPVLFIILRGKVTLIGILYCFIVKESAEINFSLLGKPCEDIFSNPTFGLVSYVNVFCSLVALEKGTYFRVAAWYLPYVERYAFSNGE